MGYGRSLMNLEYVCVNNIDGKDHGPLFGMVRVDGGRYKYTFYDRPFPVDSEEVSKEGFAALTDPSHSFPVSAEDTFIINIALFVRPQPSWPYHPIAQREIRWDRKVDHVTSQNYDTHLQKLATGEYGNVTVGYSVLSNALGVTIQVLLVNDNDRNTEEVYGTLTASQVLGGSEGLAPIALFNKSSKHPVPVGKGDPIPLTRTVIAASTSTKLKITAKLYHKNPDSPDSVIAEGSADFTVQLQPEQQSQIISGGPYGPVKVTITCN